MCCNTLSSKITCFLLAELTLKSREKQLETGKEGLNLTPEISALGSQQLPHWPGFRAKPRKRTHPVLKIKLANECDLVNLQKQQWQHFFFLGISWANLLVDPKMNEIGNGIFSAGVFLFLQKETISFVTSGV